MKLLFVCNPNAGRMTIRSRMYQVLDIFEKAGYETTVRISQKSGDPINIIKDMDDSFDRVVCSGGDGTLDEVVSGMMQREHRVPIGYLPAGSTNDFGRSLKIPRDVVRAADIAVGDDLFRCDIGSFNDKHFVYVAAFGALSEVTYETSQDQKNRLGYMAYVVNGARHVTDPESFVLRMKADGVSYEGEFIYGLITNSFSIGGFKNITGKHVKLDDGLFEVTLVKKPRNAIELNAIIASLIAREMDERYIITLKAERIQIDSVDTIPWTLDGENGGRYKRIDIVNNPRAVEFIVRA